MYDVFCLNSPLPYASVEVGDQVRTFRHVEKVGRCISCSFDFFPYSVKDVSGLQLSVRLNGVIPVV